MIYLALTLILQHNPPILTEKQQERFALVARAYDRAWSTYTGTPIEGTSFTIDSFSKDRTEDELTKMWLWYGKLRSVLVSGHFLENTTGYYDRFSLSSRFDASLPMFTPSSGMNPDPFANPEVRKAFRDSILSELTPKGFTWENSRWKKDGYLYFSTFAITLSARASAALRYEAPVETDLTNILSLADAFAVIQDELPLAKGPEPKFMRVEFVPGLSGNNMKKDAPDYELTSAGKGVAIYRIIGNEHYWIVSATTGALLSSAWYSGTTGFAANRNHVLDKPLPYPVNLPNGWLVFLTPETPREEQVWQPTTLTLPDNTTQKALISENGFFIKTEDGKTFMVGRIPN